MVFRALVIFLVVLDTALLIAEIMLEYFKLHYQCTKTNHQNEVLLERIHLTMEIAHFFSIGILVFFVLELILKIYLAGKYYWNLKKMKMEYFDAVIVIVSLALDLYFLSSGKRVLGEELFVIFSLRLWRFVRIISSEWRSCWRLSLQTALLRFQASPKAFDTARRNTNVI